EFSGTVFQVPPAYSAIKVRGQRAYDLARDGQDIVLEPRQIQIDDLKLVEMRSDGTTVFEATCGKGTYVRALARDLGRRLGCFGHITELRRTRVGNFLEADALSMDTLTDTLECHGQEGLLETLRPIELALDALIGFRVDPSDAAQLAQGQPVLIRGRDAPDASKPVYATSRGRLIALGEIEKGALRPTRVFNFAK
ncbi:MAG: tRNA pseudouridine(55) synthase TruB, partial [Alphaproteobacteria bacterium]|nr:tRNA pseudouridine(55) synthase TruB [Alphaproteobacteria bacterium]